MRKLIILLALSLAGCGAAGRICAGTGADPGASFASVVPLGAAVDWSHVRDSPAYARFFLEHYSWMTPENELKMDALEPAAGMFDFRRADAIVNWARAHGKHVHGHVLIYGSQLPGWLQLSGGLEATQALHVMTTYIDTVMRHFRGRIGEWDVVNESFTPSGRWNPNLWYQALGPRYVTDAYRIARTADPVARLCYTDCGIETPGPQAAAVLRLVKQLRMLRLIDCVGVETHNPVPGPPQRALQTMLNRFARTGVYVTISELDAQLKGDATLRQQAGTYRAVAAACRSVSRCVRITTWGFTDGSSWLGASSRALPFDARCTPKPAWSALARVLAQ